MPTVPDRHGELVGAGVQPPGDGGVNLLGEPGQAGDVPLVPGDGMAERVLIARVGAGGALEPGQGGVSLCFVHQEWVAGGQGLGLVEGQDGVADVGDFAGVE